MKKNLMLTMGLACLAVLVAVETGHAQFRGGRGIFGGGRGGSYGSFGGYGNGYGWGGYNNGWGGYNNGWGGYGSNYNWSQPYYSGSNYNWSGYPQGYSGNNYNWSAPAIANQDYGVNQNQAFYNGPGQQQQDNNVATVRVLLPNPNAQVWFNGQEMQQQGAERTFLTPPLEPGSNYSYTVRAAWNQNGQQVTRDRTVQVRAGQQANVDFAENLPNQQPVNQQIDQPRRDNVPLNQQQIDQPRRDNVPLNQQQPLNNQQVNPNQQQPLNNGQPNRQQLNPPQGQQQPLTTPPNRQSNLGDPASPRQANPRPQATPRPTSQNQEPF